MGKRPPDQCSRDVEEGELRFGKAARDADASRVRAGSDADQPKSKGAGGHGSNHATNMANGSKGEASKQQQQQMESAPMLAKQQSMLPALMGHSPLAQLQKICAERCVQLAKCVLSDFLCDNAQSATLTRFRAPVRSSLVLLTTRSLVCVLICHLETVPFFPLCHWDVFPIVPSFHICLSVLQGASAKAAGPPGATSL